MPQGIETRDTLRGRLRARMGNPDLEELNDSDLDELLSDSLNEMNSDHPASTFGSFVTVVDQNAYDVFAGAPAASSLSRAYRVKRVWWSATNQVDSSFFGVGHAGISGLTAFEPFFTDIGAGARIFDNPALVTAFAKKMRAFSNQFSGHGSQNPDDGLLYLRPTPTSVKTVYFEFTYRRFFTVNDVQEYYYKPLLLLSHSKACEALAHQRSSIVTGVGPGGTFTTGGGGLQIRQAQALRTQYNKEYRDRPVGPRYGR